MSENAFDELLESIREGGAILRNERPASRRFDFQEPDVKAIRESVRLTQSEFSSLIGVKLKTLQNWEQKRVRPTGPARALLTVVSANPQAAMEALYRGHA